jgi:hypothetical protein
MQKWFETKDPEKAKMEKERVSKSLLLHYLVYVTQDVHVLLLSNIAA